MTDSFAGINYDQSAHLQPPQDNPDSIAGPNVELHLLDKAQNDTDDNNEQTDTGAQTFSNRQLQSAMIARRIKQMVGADTSSPALQILDKQTGCTRAIEYRDIVILMRSLAGKSDFIEVLRLSGIPVSSEATAGYFEATEITDMLSLLKVLDNPRRDIELAAVLRSPFFNLTDTDLAKIRLWSRRDNQKLRFYDCVLIYCQSADDKAIAEKLANVLATLDDWRTVARRGRLAELIWHIYRQSGYLSFVCALPQADARRANLLKLHDRAIQFEGFAGNAGVPSLTRFIEFVEKLLAAGQDWSPAEPESAAGNAVRVLSVHKSKGLEFPVVFVADLDGRFSNKESKRDCLVDENLTLGLRVIDADSNSKLDSIGYQVIENSARRKSLAEEMRILYVAMTRAIDRLVLVGCIDKTNCENKLNSAGFFDNVAVPDWYLDSCQSHLDWLLCGLGAGASDDKLFSIQFYDQPQLNKLSTFIQSVKLKTKNSKLKTKGIAYDLNLLKKSLDYQYPFGDAPLLPAKRTVSQWTHRNDEFTKFDYSSSFNRVPKTVLPGEKPAVSSVEPVDGKSIGSAAHLVISLLDLSKPITADAITALIAKLTAGGAIAESVASLINAASILNFFQTDLGHAALDKNNLVFREWPFTFTIPASQWSEPVTRDSILVARKTSDESRATSDDSIIVQGIIDLLIKTPKGLLVIDFKTDDVSADSAPKRAEIYRTQLDLYARAVAAITGQTVLSKWLYFLRPGSKIEI
jgi:ATP-dependent helicase/nuclease subunit A